MTEKEQRIEELLDHLASYAPLPDPNLPILENDSFLYHQLTSFAACDLLYVAHNGAQSGTDIKQLLHAVFKLLRYIMAQGATRSYMKELILDRKGVNHESFFKTGRVFKEKLADYDAICRNPSSNVYDESSKRFILSEIFLGLKNRLNWTGDGNMLFIVTTPLYSELLTECTTSYRPPIVLTEQQEQLAVYLAKVTVESKSSVLPINITHEATKKAYQPIRNYLIKKERLRESDSEELKPMLNRYMKCLIDTLLSLNTEPYYFKYRGMKSVHFNTEMLTTGRTVRECLEALHRGSLTTVNTNYHPHELFKGYIYRLKIIQNVGTFMGFDLLGEYLDTYHIPETTPIITNEDWSL